MKTINVMMASLAALLVAACSQNEVTEVSPDAHPQMKFGVYTGTPTRGVDTDNNSIKDDPTDGNKYGGFGIMGYFTGSKGWNDAKASTAPGFMHNQKVKWDETQYRRMDVQPRQVLAQQQERQDFLFRLRTL